MTWKYRYDHSWATNLICKHARRMCITNMNMLDVGCSKGIAVAHCKKHLGLGNIAVHVTGVDATEKSKIISLAEKNLDIFINHTILDIDVCEIGKFDVITCLNTIRFVSNDTKYKIIKKCMEFLKTDGVLIIDMDIWEIPTKSALRYDFDCKRITDNLGEFDILNVIRSKIQPKSISISRDETNSVLEEINTRLENPQWTDRLSELCPKLNLVKMCKIVLKYR